MFQLKFNFNCFFRLIGATIKVETFHENGPVIHWADDKRSCDASLRQSPSDLLVSLTGGKVNFLRFQIAPEHNSRRFYDL
jgi:hypothetical protein